MNVSDLLGTDWFSVALRPQGRVGLLGTGTDCNVSQLLVDWWRISHDLLTSTGVRGQGPDHTTGTATTACRLLCDDTVQPA